MIKLIHYRTLLVLLAAVSAVFFLSQFMVVRVQENSMQPTLSDGQWALVWKGAEVHSGDIAVFISPDDEEPAVKRCVLSAGEQPRIQHGWLITPWGNWFLTESEWRNLAQSSFSSENFYFMVGDNQFHSLDSRQYGYIARDRILGKVLLGKSYD
ncbi:MAG: signal peptidase I [Spirochaeta sp. LUC14_002_19_P3]|nr:MAG: signal peptidase I [Spirochaeta sp. LUC14_002_19_P3]